MTGKKKMVEFIIRALNYIKRQYSYYRNKLKLKIYNVKFNKNIKVDGKLYIKNYGNINIKNNVYINSSAFSNPLGGACFSALITGENGFLEIGNNVGISNSSITAHKKVIIEDNVTIGNGCKIFDTDFHPVDPQERKNNNDKNIKKETIIICENAFLGTGVVVVKGVKIGKNSVVGANSVVIKSIPDNEIWAGNPARKIKDI